MVARVLSGKRRTGEAYANSTTCSDASTRSNVVSSALEYRDHGDPAGELDYADVADVVRDMIVGSIDELDEVNIARLAGGG